MKIDEVRLECLRLAVATGCSHWEATQIAESFMRYVEGPASQIANIEKMMRSGVQS